MAKQSPGPSSRQGIFSGGATNKVYAISSRALEMLLVASRDTHPNEFACMLRADDGVITELMLVPGTISSQESAILRLYMMPIDLTIVGSAHSHPSPNSIPSGPDLKLFSNSGQVHIIVGYPYDKDSWKAYARNGEEIFLDVV